MKTKRTLILFILLVAGFLALPVPVQAQLTYSVNGDGVTATITGYNTNAGLNVVIPDSINGYPVTSIGDNAHYAFYGSTITNVTIGTNVISIGLAAFYFCYNLTSVTIPSSVTSIGDQAFGGGCYNLTNISVNAANPVYSSLNGVLFDKAQVTLIQFPGGFGGNYTIPNSVTNIGDSFMNTSLTGVTIPNSVTIIEPSAFYECYSLTNATIPNSVTIIGSQAFAGCSNLTSVTIPSSVTNIGGSAFGGGCYNLTNISVNAANPVYSSLNGVLFDKAQVTLIQFPGGFGGNYTIPNSVTNIGTAFASCYNLTGVTIDTNVTSIGQSAFIRCFGLTSIAIPNSVTSIGNSAFQSCSHLAAVTIPNSVTRIGQDAFASCTNLFSITIPASVTSINSFAFTTCSKLTEIYFQGNAPSLGANVFVNVNSAMTVYYLPGTTGWGASFGGHPTAITPLPNGLTSVGSLPAVFYPQVGTNYTLQMSTNPASGNWVTVSNTVVLNALQVTNLANTAFFRLQDTSGSVPSPTIVSYGHQPVWIYQTNATYSLQMKTNLATTNWLAPSGNTFVSVQITNAPAGAVFRLH